MPTRRRITAAHQLARRLAATVMLRVWNQLIDQQIADTPEGHITRLLDAIEATGLRLHIPRQPHTHPLADRVEQALCELDLRILATEHAAALGSGQADLRTHQRGGDPVAGRIDWDAVPPHIADSEVKRLRKLRETIDNQVRYNLATFQRALSENHNQDNRRVSAGQEGSIDRTG